MAEQLNALDDNTKVQVIYRMLCELKVIARKYGYISGGACGYDRSHFDQGRAKNAGERASNNGYCMVGVHLLHRNKKNTNWLLTDAKADMLGTFYGEESLPKNTSYEPFNMLGDDESKVISFRKQESSTYKAAEEARQKYKDDPRNHWPKNRAEDFVPRPVVTHRAQLTVYDPTPDNIICAVKTLLTDEAKAPKLAAYVKEIAESVEYPENKLPFKKNTAYACIRYNPKGFLPIGKTTPRMRSVDSSLRGALPYDVRCGYDCVPKWIEIGESVTMDEMACLLCPPWKAYEYGEVNVYILLSEHPPIDVLVTRRACLHTHLYYDCNKKGVWPAHTYRPVEGEGEEAQPPYAENDYDTVMAQAPFGSFVRGGEQNLYTNGEVKAAKRLRMGQDKKGEMVKNALSVQEEEHSLAPGGAGTAAASASFQANGGGV
jgi:hypothetical protein